MYCGISVNLDRNILTTALPLFEQEAVEAIEWSFDALFHHDNIPVWFEQLLHAFANEGRLIGHGVFYSLFAGRWTDAQQQWLQDLRSTGQTYKFDHVSEHFGYMTGRDFHQGAPLSVPYNNTTLGIARDRISRMYDACQCPVGLENLAFSYSLNEVKRHGGFLDEILEAVNGFAILDLHNIYCQVQNFNVPFEKLLDCYPISKVREIHISGGSWEESAIAPETKIRRDTHDDAVPAEVFEYLKHVVPILPNLKFIMLEQMGTDLKTKESRTQFQNDFREMKSIVQHASSKPAEKFNTFLPTQLTLPNKPIQSDLLADQQSALDTILESSSDFNDVKYQLERSILKDTDWKIEDWKDTMLETAYNISQKWKDGFNIRPTKRT